MQQIERRLSLLENRLLPDSQQIFLGEPGKYAIVRGRRIDWGHFIALFPNHILLTDEDSDVFGPNNRLENGVNGEEDGPPNQKKREKPAKGGKK